MSKPTHSHGSKRFTSRRTRSSKAKLESKIMSDEGNLFGENSSPMASKITPEGIKPEHKSETKDNVPKEKEGGSKATTESNTKETTDDKLVTEYLVPIVEGDMAIAVKVESAFEDDDIKPSAAKVPKLDVTEEKIDNIKGEKTLNIPDITITTMEDDDIKEEKPATDGGKTIEVTVQKDNKIEISITDGGILIEDGNKKGDVAKESTDVETVGDDTIIPITSSGAEQKEEAQAILPCVIEEEIGEDAEAAVAAFGAEQKEQARAILPCVIEEKIGEDAEAAVAAFALEIESAIEGLASGSKQAAAEAAERQQVDDATSAGISDLQSEASVSPLDQLEAGLQPDAESPFLSPLLPCAQWGKPLKPLELTMLKYNLLTGCVRKILCLILKQNNYDSVNNFILFYDKYMKNGGPLEDFYQQYDAPIRSKQHTCVGLSLELIRRLKCLNMTFKGLSQATSILSCEEAVNNEVETYIKKSRGPRQHPSFAAEKEHVVVGVQIRIGKRVGLMIADPGYHVGRVVTVMDDGRPPHTGSFIQYNLDGKSKEYNYYVNSVNKSYVEWHEVQITNGIEKHLVSLIFKSRPYLSAVAVTEKRNVIFNLKSHLKRDSRGSLLAGYYFGLNTDFEAAQVTVFVGLKAKIKLMFKDFSDPHNIPPDAIEAIGSISSYMNYSSRYVISVMCKLAKIMANKSFIDKVMYLNNEVIPSLKAYNENGD